MGPGDDRLDIYCRRCGGENTMRFEDASQNRTLTCTSCGRPLYWRSCPACETGWVAERPGDPCPECGADPEGHIPELPTPAPRGRRSPWHRACPVCGTRFVPFLAPIGGRYLCPHCKRVVEDTSPAPLVLGRAAVVLALVGVSLSLLDGWSRALLGTGYGAIRPVWLAGLGVLLIAAGLAWLTQAMRLRPWRP